MILSLHHVLLSISVYFLILTHTLATKCMTGMLVRRMLKLVTQISPRNTGSPSHPSRNRHMLIDVKFRQIEGNGRKLRHIELSNSVIS